ncbi:PTS sugar transporter subunit IIA [Desulforegula conservatrix]|uniref:PTS sugar transporter subunit IIA n=1 Tax=Desulforegula conservatrix TaxID=153026 RepID=UPI0003F54135|nr:PTS fructose transporter subunit IIA [Desulforegula conservatrix]
MIGIVIVTHAQLGHALLETAEAILGEKIENSAAVSINLTDDVDNLRNLIDKAVKKAKSENGVLILTDMFGGTPSNLSYSFLEDGKIEVLSGVNLPIVLKAINLRKKLTLAEMAIKLEEQGKKSISLASSILKGNKRSV